MARKLKVFQGIAHGRGKPQVNTVVAAVSQKEAAALLNISIGTLRNYWSVTGNAKAIEAAMQSPGTVYQASDIGATDFEPKE